MTSQQTRPNAGRRLRGMSSENLRKACVVLIIAAMTTYENLSSPYGDLGHGIASIALLSIYPITVGLAIVAYLCKASDRHRVETK